MSNRKRLDQLTELTAPASGDYLYIVDSSDTTDSAQGSSRKVQLSNLNPGAVNVKWYGATGDGTTDDTTAFGAARASGATQIVVPAGTYSVTGLTLSTSNQTWVLERGSTIKLAASTNADVITINASGVVITGYGTIDGNKANNGTSCNGIFISSVDDCKISGITIKDCIDRGVFGRNADRTLIEGITTQDTENFGIYVENTSGQGDLTEVRIVNNFVDRSSESAATITGGGISVFAGQSGTNALRCIISGNIVKMPDNPTSNTAICILTRRFKNGLITNNQCYQGAFGISFDTDTGDHNAVQGNSIFGPRVNGGTSYGIEVAGGDNCTMSNNVIQGNSTTYGIGITDTTSTGTCIQGNTISGVVNAAIFSNGYEDTVISNNQCLDNIIECVGVDDTIIIGNRVIMGSTAGDSGVKCTGGSGQNLLIANNYIESTSGTTQCIQVSGHINTVIQGNILDGNSNTTHGMTLTGTYPLVVSGNMCRQTTTFVQFLETTAVTVDDVMISGNVYDGAGAIANIITETLSGGAALGTNFIVSGNSWQVTSAYTPTNVVTDRSYDANSTTTDELADVLGTLIADLQSQGIIA